jgi:hypothetical protein
MKPVIPRGRFRHAVFVVRDDTYEHRLVEDEERAAKKTSGGGFRNGRLCCGLAIGRFLREAQRSQPRGFLPFGTALLRVFYHGRVLILFSE